MTKKLELYKCNICGNIVEVVIDGVGELVCCGEPMEQLEAKTSDSAYGEKHVPVIIEENESRKVQVGSVLHPMENEHYIQFIETVSEDKTLLKRKYYQPNELPVMNLIDNETKAREYCNIHGLWSNMENI